MWHGRDGGQWRPQSIFLRRRINWFTRIVIMPPLKFRSRNKFGHAERRIDDPKRVFFGPLKNTVTFGRQTNSVRIFTFEKTYRKKKKKMLHIETNARIVMDRVKRKRKLYRVDWNAIFLLRFDIRRCVWPISSKSAASYFRPRDNCSPLERERNFEWKKNKNYNRWRNDAVGSYGRETRQR